MLKDFCENSTVHGVRYFAEPKRHWIERVWWAFAFTLSVIFCTVAIMSIWSKWSGHPVIVTFDDKTTSVSMIPFPAATICSTQKFSKKNLNTQLFDGLFVEDITELNYSSLLPEAINQFDAMGQICFKQNFAADTESVRIPENQSIYKAIIEILPKPISMAAFWMSEKIPKSRFQPIFTEEGLCFTINSLNSMEIYSNEITRNLVTVRRNLNATHWNAEDGYQSIANDNELYPHRVFSAGLRDSLYIKLRIWWDEYSWMCGNFASGFRLSLHMADDLPQFTSNFYHIPTDQNIFMLIKPKVIRTSNGLRNYAPRERGCYFRSERRLRFFKSYSQQKCELECFANFTRNECGCVRFWMPRDVSTKVCTIFNMDCLIDAEIKFAKKLIVVQCTCLPDCNSISYYLEMSQTQIQPLEEASGKPAELSKAEAFTEILISFKEHNFIALNRSESSTMADFISSCGGLLGLCLGVSMLSVIELIYFSTLRLCCKWRQQRTIQANSRNWVGHWP